MASHGEPSFFDVIGQNLVSKDLLVAQLGVAVNLWQSLRNKAK
jgi:hypothetical protein